MRWFTLLSIGTAILMGLLWIVPPAYGPVAVGGKPIGLRTDDLKSDFNGDGYADLAVGVPLDDLPGIKDAGSVTVLYGSAQGLSSTNQLWHQDSPGVLDSAEIDDEFGSSLATGDFNGDGFSDLAVGVSDEGVGAIEVAGAVNVLYGSAEGLSAAGSQFWHQDSRGIKGEAKFGEEFGRALAAGDFNGDRFADLAVGVPFEGGGFEAFGAVNVLYGSSGGLTAEGNQLWSQDSPGVKDVSESGDLFGFAVSAGDYNGDGSVDLAISVGGEDPGGAVNVLYGSPSGLSATGDQFWTQDSRGIKDTAEESDGFAAALVSGDFSGDGYADLAVGASGESIDYAVRPVTFAGAVNVLFGSSSGLTAEGNQFWHQDIPGIKDFAEHSDGFGLALAAGDFNGDGFADLGIAAPFEDLAFDAAGAVHVLFGSPSGLAIDENQFWHQDSRGIKDAVELADTFGFSIVGRDYDNDGNFDLAISVPYEDIQSIRDAGAVHVLYGTIEGLSTERNQFWRRSSPGIIGKVQSESVFGLSLSDSGSPR